MSPIVDVSLLEGAGETRLFALAGALTEAVVRELGVRPEQVRVVLREVSPSLWFVGGRPLQPRPAPASRNSDEQESA